MDLHEIQSVLQSAVQERTFSLDAVNAIKELKDRFEVLRDDHTKVTNDYENAAKANRELKARLMILDGDLGTYMKREDELSKREVKCMRIEVENQYQSQRCTDLRDIMLSLTRNLEYRRELNDSHTRNGNDGNYSNNTNIVDEKTEAR